MGSMFVYQSSELIETSSTWFGVPYFSISLSLNTFLTLMIVIRLILQARNTRTAMGISGIGGFSKTIIAMLVESCALYAMNSLLVIGTWGAGDSIWGFFMNVLPEIQVRGFPQPRSPNRLSDVIPDFTGHRSAAHHSTSCK